MKYPAIALACAVLAAATICPSQTATAPASAPAASPQIGRYIERSLAKDAAAREEWCFGVVADPHLFLYGWNDGGLRNCLVRWAAAKASFGIVIGDSGTGPNLQPDADNQTLGRMEKAATQAAAWRAATRAAATQPAVAGAMTASASAPASQPDFSHVKSIRQTEKFSRVIASVAGCPPVFLSVGNHELDGDGKRGWLEMYYPGAVGAIDGNGNDRFFYFSFDYRLCHFVSLDANRVLDKRAQLGMAPEAELAWLEQDLDANKGKLTFVFLHEPLEQCAYDTPYYLLQNRARLLDILRRHSDVKWVFHGHLHYDAWTRAWGLNVVHCAMGNQVIRVKGQQAELCRVTPKGIEPAKGPYDLGADLARRQVREGERIVYRIAEEKLEPDGRDGTLAKNVALVESDGQVKPTAGPTMMHIRKTLGARAARSYTNLSRYLSSIDVIPIVKGMTFSYDVRCQDSVYDNVAVNLRIAMPAGRQRPKLVDQNGIPMDNLSPSASPSLKGKADGQWYHRECGLSPLEGGWIDLVTLCLIRPNGAPYSAGDLNVYIDNIQFTWPAPPAPAAPSQP